MYKSWIIGMLLICMVPLSLFAQGDNCDCSTDLLFLHKKIKKMPAYKVNKKAYQSVYQKALSLLPSVQHDYDCFILMNRMLLSLNDNHARLYGVANPEKATASNILALPKIDLDQLRKQLAAKAQDSIEGIYQKGSLQIGIYYDNALAMYRAIILKTDATIWQEGELLCSFLPYGNGYLLGFGYKYANKRFISFNERVNQGRLLALGLQKDPEAPNFSVSPYPDTSFFRKEISEELCYIKVGSFDSFYPKLSEAEAFYKSLVNTLTKKHLILDLRGNPGGGERNSDILLKILKKYLKQNKLYILTNHSMASNAEQFIMKLAEQENCITLGDRTNGTAAYEVKNSIYTLPCEKYIAILTSKKHKKYLAIESKGIEPAVYLDFNRSWIEQVQAIIAQQ